jgi:hypothetical protein
MSPTGVITRIDNTNLVGKHLRPFIVAFPDWPGEWAYKATELEPIKENPVTNLIVLPIERVFNLLHSTAHLTNLVEQDESRFDAWEEELELLNADLDAVSVIIADQQRRHQEAPISNPTVDQAVLLLKAYKDWIGKTPAERELLSVIRLTYAALEDK